MRTILLNYFFPDLNKVKNLPYFPEMSFYANMCIIMLMALISTTLGMLAITLVPLVVALTTDSYANKYAAYAASATGGAFTLIAAGSTFLVLRKLYKLRTEGISLSAILPKIT